LASGELGQRDAALHRGHAAVGARHDALRDAFHGLADGRRHLLGRLDVVGRDVDDADQLMGH